MNQDDETNKVNNIQKLESNETNESLSKTNAQSDSNLNLNSSPDTTTTTNSNENLSSPSTSNNDVLNKQEMSLSLDKLSTTTKDDTKTTQQQQQSGAKSPTSQSNCILFYGVTYLGCASVNAPKSESEINRVMTTLNEQGKVVIEVTMSVPQLIEEKIILYDNLNTESKIAEYKMAHVLFVVRGGKNTSESNCFAFTTCHGDSMDNLIFSCHVFRCNLIDAVSKILYSFWTVFNRQNLQKQQQIQEQQQQQQQQQNSHKQRNSESSITSTAGQLSSVASSLLGSLTGIGSFQTSSFSSFGNSNSLNASNQNSNNLNSQFIEYCDFAVKFVNGSIENQYVFRAILEIKEEDPKNPSSFVTVPKEKEFFKLRKNLDKQINIQIQQLTNQPLEIERCFGLLMCQGRNVSHKDMQLLQTISMGKSGSNSNDIAKNSTYNSGYLVSALWKPSETANSLQVLNEETQKNARVFMTIAVDLVINGLQDPVRFCIETKVRVYPQNEKFWVYQKYKHYEQFYLQIVKNASKPDAPVSPTSNNIFSLHSIHSQTELVRKRHAIEHQNKMDMIDDKQANDQNMNISDDENDLVMSGIGNVSKDCPEEELMDWSDLLSRWRKATWNERPRGLQSLVRKGIPEALRGEVWQLLAGCNENEKSMNESYRLLLSKDSPSENVILRDINRTFPGHQFFQDENGQQALYKISKAYSIYDEEVGYCQGLSFLIASLLLHMPEEQAFNLLVKIMYRYEVREIFKTNFECLHLRFYQLENLMREYLPELYEHFIDLNIETHMYASQWFLTLFTAKFPLYMVFRILDLFLSEGFLVIFSIALSLLKSSQRDLLALDFEGVLKYFRVNLPKKYRAEQNFQNLMFIWANLHSKLNDKKIKKIEKNYKLMKEAEALKEDPALRYEKECKRLTQLNRRLEQENDDLANEYIDAKIALSKQIEELKDNYELAKNELFKYKTDYQNKLNENFDTNKKLMSELEQIKELWRKQSEKYEGELERNNVIISEYKNICNSLSNKVEKWSNFKKKYDSKIKKFNLCEQCTENNKIEDENHCELSSSTTELYNLTNNNPNNNNSSSSASSNDPFDDYTHVDLSFNQNTKFDLADSSLTNLDTSGTGDNKSQEQESKIKNLELELARVKLELVDAQCKNQEFDHKIKTILNSTSSDSRNGSTNLRSISSTSQNIDNPNLMSVSTTSINSNSSLNTNNTATKSTQNQNNLTSSLLNSSTTTLNGGGGGGSATNNNNWLSKTFTQFKEATNQVVQKAQKAKANS